MLKISHVICKSIFHWNAMETCRNVQNGGTHNQSNKHGRCKGEDGDGDDFTWVTVLLEWQGETFPEKMNRFSFHAILPAGVSLVTLTAHFMTSAVSSHTTRSTHLRLGSFSLRICFLTIASKARSGVNSPVLNGHGVRLHFVVVGERKG